MVEISRPPLAKSQIRIPEKSFCGIGGLGSDRRCELGVLGRHPR
jgi:hypothetical protein